MFCVLETDPIHNFKFPIINTTVVLKVVGTNTLATSSIADIDNKSRRVPSVVKELRWPYLQSRLVASSKSFQCQQMSHPKTKTSSELRTPFPTPPKRNKFTTSKPFQTPLKCRHQVPSKSMAHTRQRRSKGGSRPPLPLLCL